MTEKNTNELINQKNVDGFLVGGASIKPAFTDIVTGSKKWFIFQSIWYRLQFFIKEIIMNNKILFDCRFTSKIKIRKQRLIVVQEFVRILNHFE